ncbi:MAG: methylmalonyl-CoA epimerase [candidate division WOR-3 bacterium]
MIKKIDHIAIAVSNLKEAARFYEENLGLKLSGDENLPEQGVKVGFIQIGEVRIELVEPLSPTSPISKFLAEKGPGLHHICFEVDDIEKELSRLAEAGVRLIDSKPRPGAHNTKVAFIHPKASGGVLIEFSQKV